jgi:hypothetical protein
MNQFVERYRAGGHPATAAIRVAGLPEAGQSVTIAGQEYVYGVHFTGADKFEIAKSLVATINAEPNSMLNPGDNQPIKNYYAIFYSDLIRLVCTFPGPGGNALALATNASGVFEISGGTFVGGAGPGSAIPAPATARSREAQPSPLELSKRGEDAQQPKTKLKGGDLGTTL